MTVDRHLVIQGGHENHAHSSTEIRGDRQVFKFDQSVEDDVIGVEIVRFMPHRRTACAYVVERDIFVGAKVAALQLHRGADRGGAAESELDIPYGKIVSHLEFCVRAKIAAGSLIEGLLSNSGARCVDLKLLNHGSAPDGSVPMTVTRSFGTLGTRGLGWSDHFGLVGDFRQRCVRDIRYKGTGGRGGNGS